MHCDEYSFSLGMCSVTYREARPTTDAGNIGNTIDSFNVGNAPTTPEAGETLGASGIGATCATVLTSTSAVIIEPVGEICGGVFSGKDNQLLPGTVTGNFEVQVFVVGGTATQAMSGFDLIYGQNPC